MLGHQKRLCEGSVTGRYWVCSLYDLYTALTHYCLALGYPYFVWKWPNNGQGTYKTLTPGWKKILLGDHLGRKANYNHCHMNWT